MSPHGRKLLRFYRKRSGSKKLVRPWWIVHFHERLTTELRKKILEERVSVQGRKIKKIAIRGKCTRVVLACMRARYHTRKSQRSAMVTKPISPSSIIFFSSFFFFFFYSLVVFSSVKVIHLFDGEGGLSLEETRKWYLTGSGRSSISSIQEEVFQTASETTTTPLSPSSTRSPSIWQWGFVEPQWQSKSISQNRQECRIWTAHSRLGTSFPWKGRNRKGGGYDEIRG